MPSSSPVSIRLPVELFDRILTVIAATDRPITRSELIAQALSTWFRMLDADPSLLPSYHIERDRLANPRKGD